MTYEEAKQLVIHGRYAEADEMILEAIEKQIMKNRCCGQAKEPGDEGMKCKHENLTPVMFNGYFVMICQKCGKWVIDMTPKEINTTTIDWRKEE